MTKTTPSHPVLSEKRSLIPALGEREAEWRDLGAGASRKQTPYPIIAICHLSWDWVWQRPQQFLSRFSSSHPVLFVETRRTETFSSFTRSRTAVNHPEVTILEMHLPAARWHEGGFIDAERRRVLQDCLKNEFKGRFDQAVLWFNDPMAATAFAGHLGERLVVYDCMDELTQFQGAPPDLCEREQELTKKADLIFCGGRKMREKRLPLNPNTHFFGTGVDCQHFGTALGDSLEVEHEIAQMRGPVLGYFGVVDERIDYDLLAALADAEPHWNIVMVGPVAKVPMERLPRRPNLHWLGGRPYLRLPAITKGFSVCLMPFARNASTEFINPTKALEYMAAGKPVVSTDLAEVRSNFNSIARIAADQEEFIEMCRSEVNFPSRLRRQRGLKLAAENTWEAIIACMEARIAERLRPAALPVESMSRATRKRAVYV